MLRVSKLLVLGLMLLTSQSRASGIEGEGGETTEEKMSLPCEVQPELIQSSRPLISGRNILISTWRMASRRSPAILYFTFVFDQDTNTPDRPIYALEGRSEDSSVNNHRTATDWVDLQLTSISPLTITPIEEPVTQDMIPMPPPVALTRHETIFNMDTLTPEFSVQEERNDTVSPPSNSELEQLERYLIFSPRGGSIPGWK